MSKAFKCDRCEKYYDVLLNNTKYYQIIKLESYIDNKPVDLCTDCYEKLEKFLKEGE